MTWRKSTWKIGMSAFTSGTKRNQANEFSIGQASNRPTAIASTRILFQSKSAKHSRGDSTIEKIFQVALALVADIENHGSKDCIRFTFILGISLIKTWICLLEIID